MAWQRVRQVRAQQCAASERAQRAGLADLELLYALRGKSAPAAEPSAAAAAANTSDKCARGRAGHTIARDLAPFLVVHFKDRQGAAADDAARAAAQQALKLADAAALKEMAPAAENRAR